MLNPSAENNITIRNEIKNEKGGKPLLEAVNLYLWFI